MPVGGFTLGSGDGWMDTALRQALDDGEHACRALLLARAAEQRAAVGLGADSDLSALQAAALYDDEAASALLARGVACDLHSACALGRVADIQRLVRGESLAALAEHLPPLGFALVRGQLASVRALLALGDDPNRPLPRIGFYAWEMDALASEGRGFKAHPWRPLHAACAHGYAPDAPQIAQALIHAGARLAAPCPLGDLPIHLAATHGWLAVLDMLLTTAADIEARTTAVSESMWRLSSPAHSEPTFGQTPLAIAAREGHTDAARLLLRHGAAIDAIDSRGWTPLHTAAAPWWQENAELAALLIAAGADLHARNHDGHTPLDLAKAASHTQTVALFAEASRS